MEFKYVPTVCPFCGTGCSFNLVVKDGKVVGTAPFQRSPVCDGKTCQKGHYAYELANSDARIKTPMIKKGEALVEATWGEALAAIADKSAEFSPEQVAVIASANATNEDIYTLKKLATEVFATENFTTAAAVGIDASAGTIADIAKAECIVAVGNIVESHPLIARRIANAIDNGAKVITIDTYSSPMAKMATEFIKSAPGAEIEAIKEAVSFIEGKSTFVLFGIGMGISDLAVAKAAKELADDKGAVFCALPAQANGRGALNIGADKSYNTIISNETIKAYYVMGEDLGPLDAEFIVVLDSFLSETAKVADVVLPAAVFAEVDGTITNAERRIQLLRKAQEPEEGIKANWQIIADIAAKLDKDFGYESAEAIFGEIYPDLSFEAISKDGFILEAKAAVIAESEEPASVDISEEYPLALISGPTIWHGFGASGTLSKNCKSLYHEISGMFVKICKEDAKEYGLLAGDSVKITTEKGSIKMPIMVTSDVDKGTIFVPLMCIGEECIRMLTGGERAVAAKIEKEA